MPDCAPVTATGAFFEGGHGSTSKANPVVPLTDTDLPSLAIPEVVAGGLSVDWHIKIAPMLLSTPIGLLSLS